MKNRDSKEFELPEIVVAPPAPPGGPECRVCGCWEYNACVDKFAGPCFWVDGDLCSACVTSEVGGDDARSE